MSKAGFVTIAGKPNVGKSTLMNTMIGQKLAITSYKPQTTRKQMRTVYTDKRGQIVFLDTPGMNADKTGSAAGTAYTGYFRTQLGDYMEKAAESSLDEVDVVLLLVEPKGKVTAEDEAIIKLLPKSVADGGKSTVILVVNKIDSVPQEKVARTIEVFSKEYRFDEIVPVSARSKAGVEDLISTMFMHLPDGAPFYDEDTVTNVNERDLVADIIREKALRLLQDEVPHGVAVTVDSFKYRKGRNNVTICDIDASIITEKETHKAIIIGKGGEMLKKIGTVARIDIENLIQNKVNLKLWVKVRKDWRDDDQQRKSYGYDMKDLK